VNNNFPIGTKVTWAHGRDDNFTATVVTPTRPQNTFEYQTRASVFIRRYDNNRTQWVNAEKLVAIESTPDDRYDMNSDAQTMAHMARFYWEATPSKIDETLRDFDTAALARVEMAANAINILAQRILQERGAL